MTPNEKANELIEKFCNVIPIEANITDSVEEANRKLIADKRASVQCAIIAVEEIIKANPYSHVGNSTINFGKQLKKSWKMNYNGSDVNFSCD